jgi:hypothetical protein
MAGLVFQTNGIPVAGMGLEYRKILLYETVTLMGAGREGEILGIFP